MPCELSARFSRIFYYYFRFLMNNVGSKICANRNEKNHNCLIGGEHYLLLFADALSSSYTMPDLLLKIEADARDLTKRLPQQIYIARTKK